MSHDDQEKRPNNLSFTFDEEAYQAEVSIIPEGGMRTERLRQLKNLFETYLATYAANIDQAVKYTNIVAMIDKTIREDISINLKLYDWCATHKMDSEPAMSESEKEALAAEVEALLFPEESDVF